MNLISIQIPYQSNSFSCGVISEKSFHGCDGKEKLDMCFDRSENVSNYNLIKNQYDNFEHDEKSIVINVE